ncbi:hypothetical protein TNCV_3139301 [Trichonephila clavipes]|nr:hypothetical protein TNCV_3139301 [Trichonephila clavipes]
MFNRQTVTDLDKCPVSFPGIQKNVEIELMQNTMTVERRSSESIGTGYRSDNRTPNAIHAVYEAGHYAKLKIITCGKRA